MSSGQQLLVDSFIAGPIKQEALHEVSPQSGTWGIQVQIRKCLITKEVSEKEEGQGDKWLQIFCLVGRPYPQRPLGRAPPEGTMGRVSQRIKRNPPVSQGGGGRGVSMYEAKRSSAQGFQTLPLSSAVRTPQHRARVEVI